VCFFYLKNLYTAKYVTTGFTFNLLIYLYLSKKNKHRKHGFKKKRHILPPQIVTVPYMANTYTYIHKKIKNKHF